MIDNAEIVNALKWLAKETEFEFAAEKLRDAADLIKSMQAQLSTKDERIAFLEGARTTCVHEVARLTRERDALYDAVASAEKCSYCAHDDECEHSNSKGCTTGEWEWRGVREGGAV